MFDAHNKAQRPIHVSDAITNPTVSLSTEPESILNESRIQPSYAGVVHPGIKVPYEEGTSRLSAIEKRTYDSMFREKKSPDEIEKALGKSLRPFNVPYFSVYRSECLSNPDHADQIRSLYGDADGNIRRLKVILVSENWWEVLPHKLAAFRTSGLYCSSKRIDGQLIASRNPEPDAKVENVQRVFNREKITLPCLPDQCPIYQSKGCRFSGVLHFMILGISGTDLWRLPSTSWHAIGGIYKKLRHFHRLLQERGKSIVGIPFTLYKVQKNLSRWQPGKGLVRTKQWIFRIDAPELPVADFMVQISGFDSPLSVEGHAPAAQAHVATPADEPKSTDHQKIKAGGEPSSIEAGQNAATGAPEPEARDLHKGVGNPEAERQMQVKPYPPEEDPQDRLAALGKKIFSEIDPIGTVSLKIVKAFLSEREKTGFDDLSQEEASDLYRKVLEEKKTKDVQKCASCASVLTEKVAEYAMDKYKEPLCLKCQHKKPSRLPHRTSTAPKPQGKIESFF